MGENIKLIVSDANVKPLLDAIERQPHLWDQIKARQETPGSPHSDTETIFLRWAKEQDIDSCFNDLEPIDYPAIQSLPETRQLISMLVDNTLAWDVGRVLIVKLNPGGLIDPHIDEGPYADKYERFHISLMSEPDNHFFVENGEGHGEFVHMKPGQVWWFNHKKKHWAYNGSPSPRIHLIVDCIAPEYRRSRDAI